MEKPVTKYKKRIKILIVDDHAIVRMGLVSLLETIPEFRVIGEATDGTEAIAKAKEFKPEIIIMDILMPGCDGVAATKAIRKATRKPKIVVLTTTTSARDLNQIREAGAKGIVMKGASNDELLKAIRTVAGGQVYISQEAQALIATNPKSPKLTNRQCEILQHLVRGLTNKEIAKLCGVSANCIKIHISTLFRKLNASNRAEVATVAMRDHLVQPN